MMYFHIFRFLALTNAVNKKEEIKILKYFFKHDREE